VTIWHLHAAVSLDMKLARPDGSVDDWPHPGTPTVVMTSRPLADPPPGVAAKADLAAAVAELEARGCGRVWIEGGGQIVRDLMRLGKLDVLETGGDPDRARRGDRAVSGGNARGALRARGGPALDKGRDASGLPAAPLRLARAAALVSKRRGRRRRPWRASSTC
jgi:hypothetical protein